MLQVSLCPHCHQPLPLEPASPVRSRARRAPQRPTSVHRISEPRKPAITDYPVDKATYRTIVRPSPKLSVKFGDGEVIRAPAVSLKGKPVNVGRALRGAVDRYRTRISDPNRVGWRLDPGCYVPKIIEAFVEGGEVLDPALCSEFTAAAREPRRIRPLREIAYPPIERGEIRNRRLACYRAYRRAGHPALVAWNVAKENFR